MRTHATQFYSIEILRLQLWEINYKYNDKVLEVWIAYLHET